MEGGRLLRQAEAVRPGGHEQLPEPIGQISRGGEEGLGRLPAEAPEGDCGEDVAPGDLACAFGEGVDELEADGLAEAASERQAEEPVGARLAQFRGGLGPEGVGVGCAGEESIGARPVGGGPQSGAVAPDELGWDVAFVGERALSPGHDEEEPREKGRAGPGLGEQLAELAGGRVRDHADVVPLDDHPVARSTQLERQAAPGVADDPGEGRARTTGSLDRLGHGRLEDEESFVASAGRLGAGLEWAGRAEGPAEGLEDLPPGAEASADPLPCEEGVHRLKERSGGAPGEPPIGGRVLCTHEDEQRRPLGSVSGEEVRPGTDHHTEGDKHAREQGRRIGLCERRGLEDELTDRAGEGRRIEARPGVALLAGDRVCTGDPRLHTPSLGTGADGPQPRSPPRSREAGRRGPGRPGRAERPE